MSDAVTPTNWRRLGGEAAYRGYVRVRRDRYAMPDGEIADWDVLEDGHAVFVLALTVGERSVLTFEQFRVGPQRALVELPGGMIDAGETPERAAVRELLEETGHRPGAVLHAGSEWTVANSERRKHAVIAIDCAPAPDAPERPEEPGVIGEIPLEGIAEHLIAGDLTDAGEAMRALHAFARADVPERFQVAQRAVRSALLGPLQR